MAPEAPDTNPLSGVPPIAWLSGLNYGPGGSNFSGQSQQGSLSGTQQAGVQPGITGGLTLAELQQYLALQNASQPGAANTSSLLAAIGGQGLGAGSFGQQAGGIGGQSQIAGQTANAPTGMIAGSGGGTSADPAALLQKFLGAASTAVGTASPQAGDQNSGDQTGAASVSTASPIVQNYGSDFAASVGNQSPVTVFNQLKAAGLTDSEANDVMMLQTEAPESRGGFGVGITPGANTTAGTFGQQGNVPGGNTAGAGGGLSGVNIGGALSGGAATGAGLLSLIQGIQSGNLPQDAAGILQSIGGISGLLKAFPAAGDFLGLSGGALGNIGTAAGGIGGALGVEQGIQGLISGKNPVQSAIQLGGGAISAYNALSQLTQEFPSLTQAATQAFASAFPEAAASLGISAGGAAGAQIAGQAAGEVIGGAGFGPGIVTLGSDVSEGLNLDKNERLISEALQAIPVIGTPIAMITNAIEQAFNPRSNYAINKLAGSMGPSVIGNLEQTAGLLPPGTDLNQLTTPQLESLIPRYGNALAGYYSAEGAGMPGGHGGDATAVMAYLHGLQRTDPEAYAQSQKALQADQTSMLQAIADLQGRGVGNDVLGGLMAPQLNNVSDMYNSNFANGFPNWTSPAANFQLGGMNSFQDLASAYGGPTFLELNQIFGPQLGGLLGQYGGTAPQFTAPPVPQAPTPDIQAAQQYQGAGPTAYDLQTQYGGMGPAYLAAYQQALAQTGDPALASMIAASSQLGQGPSGGAGSDEGF